MHIKYLELENFKSYRNRVVVDQFSPVSNTWELYLSLGELYVPLFVETQHDHWEEWIGQVEFIPRHTICAV